MTGSLRFAVEIAVSPPRSFLATLPEGGQIRPTRTIVCNMKIGLYTYSLGQSSFEQAPRCLTPLRTLAAEIVRFWPFTVVKPGGQRSFSVSLAATVGKTPRHPAYR